MLLPKLRRASEGDLRVWACRCVAESVPPSCLNETCSPTKACPQSVPDLRGRVLQELAVRYLARHPRIARRGARLAAEVIARLRIRLAAINVDRFAASNEGAPTMLLPKLSPGVKRRSAGMGAFPRRHRAFSLPQRPLHAELTVPRCVPHLLQPHLPHVWADLVWNHSRLPLRVLVLHRRLLLNVARCGETRPAVRHSGLVVNEGRRAESELGRPPRP